MPLEELSIEAQKAFGWTKSSRSASGGCCLVAKAIDFDTPDIPRLIALRDSKYARDLSNEPAAEPVIVITAEQWEQFLAQIQRSGHASSSTGLLLTEGTDGAMRLTSTEDQTILDLTAAEWDAFVAGVQQGEMTATLLAAANPT